MPEATVGWVGLALSAVLLFVPVAVSAWRRLGLTVPLLGASGRMLAQLLIVGSLLALVFEAPLVVSVAWVVGIVVYASVTVRRRAAEVPDVLGLALLANAAAAAVTLGVVFGLDVFPLEPRFLVPVAGMMVGNSLQQTVLAGRRVVDELRDKRDEVEARLALGQPWTVAARPYVRAAVRTAMIPQIERTRAVGVVFLPGLMTGLILAGADPVDAVRAQAAIMFLVLAAVATTTSTLAVGVARRLFTADHRLVRLPRPAAPPSV